MKESYVDKVKRLMSDIDNKVCPGLSIWQKIGILIDFSFEKFTRDVELIDYVQYGFYWKKRRERKRFMTHGELLKIMRACNNPEHRYIFDSKPEFNRAFNNYLGREWLDTSNSSYEEYAAFLRGKDEVFVKDPSGMFGKGIQCFDAQELTSKEKYNEIKNTLIEEALEQCEEFAEFNASSTNTMRLVTLITREGEVKVMAAVLRIGRKGQVADNFHHYGIAALIDVETGIVKTTGVDRDFRRYVIHPDSEKTIVGFQVPEWDKVIKTVKEAAKVIPDMRYIGWDVAINAKHEIVLIEGNPGADPDICQIPDQVGKWNMFKKFI